MAPTHESDHADEGARQWAIGSDGNRPGATDEVLPVPVEASADDDVRRRTQRILDIAADFQRDLTTEQRTELIGSDDLLYDERGLPA